MKKPVNRKRRSIQKAHNVVVIRSDRKDPPDLQRLVKALFALKLEEARAARPAPKTRPDQ